MIHFINSQGTGFLSLIGIIVVIFLFAVRVDQITLLGILECVKFRQK